MTQKERLIELLQNILTANVVSGGKSVGRKVAIASHIADYLLENGMFVPLCKVGDKVEILDSRYEKQGHKKVCTDYVATGVVDSIVVGELGIPQYNVCYGDNEWTAILDARDIGDTTLYAVNEAEEARRRGESNG